jgi:type I restriction enzyme S subunit
MIGDAVGGSKYISSTRKKIRSDGVSRSRMVKPGDLLLTNSMSFGKPYILDTSGCIHDGWLVLSPRSDDIVPDFFYYLLGSETLYEQFSRLAAGAVVKNLNIDLVKSVKVALPSHSEQRRIADILDKADAIRRKRKEAIALTEELLHSEFLEMFGDPATNPKEWPVRSFEELLTIPLRNGLSPASGGKHSARVLTLSAITSRTFRSSASKDAMFAVEPWDDVRVDGRDFLICRGNGNKGLVGRGAFPTQADSSMVFPDTMIAARVDTTVVAPEFLAAYWNSKHVCRQLESGARTTNGTFKINQAVVEGVQVVLPPRDVQTDFQRLALRTTRTLAHLHDGVAYSERLFETLVAHTFGNDLSGSEGVC